MHPCLQASQSVESVGGSFQNFDCSKVTNIITQKSPSSHKRDLVDTKECYCSNGGARCPN